MRRFVSFKLLMSAPSLNKDVTKDATYTNVPDFKA